MAQLSKGDTFADGQQVTGARLNQLVDSAVLSTGAITDQTNITANTVASNDSVLLYDLSATALREANVSDVLNSNLPITTSAVTAGSGGDLTITAVDSAIVSGVSYVSADGITVSVFSTAHLLLVGQVVVITLAGTGYNGTFRVATVAANTFTYTLPSAVTVGSGTLSYTKKGLVKNVGNEVVSENLYVDGTLNIAGNINGTSAVKIATGTTAERPASPVAGQIRYNTTSSVLEVYSGTAWINGVTSGSANFDGTVNIEDFTIRNKRFIFGIYDTTVYQVEVKNPVSVNTLGSPSYSTTSYGYYETTVAHTKTADEIWNFTLSFEMMELDFGTASSPVSFTTECQLEDGTVLKATETIVLYVTYTEPRTHSINVSVPLGTVFTAKKVRFYFKFLNSANVWYTPNSNSNTILADHPSDTYWSNANKTLTLSKSLLSNYP